MNKPITLLDTVRDLSRGFALEAARHDRDASFPFENFEQLSQAGLLSLVTPASLGGRGAGLTEASAVIGLVAQGDPSTALVLTMQYLQHARLADGRWPAHLAERVGRDAVSGVSLINALRVEPELGSPSRGGLPATLARRTGDTWRISGHKIYSTGSPILSWLAVWARTDEPEPRLGTLLVPRSTPGIRLVETWDHLGLRASGSHDVIFEDVEVPLDHAVDLRSPAEWLVGENDTFTWVAVLLASLYDGVGRVSRDWLVEFANSRAPSGLGAPLSTLSRFQETVGEIERLLAVNERLIRSAAQDVDRGVPLSLVDSGIIKSTVGANAIAVVEKAIAISGNPGLTRKNPLERHLRDVLCARIHTPQDDSVRIAAGRRALGL